ncbi:MAG: amylo-alpha-1,6-glucosidase [Deltaproteobacteria bacterium]|nr:amylo-alpha-1,6-glucosidase [Deltaproteobacteria bacterium]
MKEISRIKDTYYIVATSSMVDPHRLILKDDDMFGIFDRFGDILPLGKEEQGLYYKGTRFLSSYELRINGMRPLFLSSNIDEDNIVMSVDLTNPDIYSKDGLALNRDSIHIMRSRLLLDGRCLEYIRLKNFGHGMVAFSLELSFGTDFKDIFEVRGLKRKRRGTMLPPESRGRRFTLSYMGLDRAMRTTCVAFSSNPDTKKDNTFGFDVTLKPASMESFFLTIGCRHGNPAPSQADFDGAVKKARKKTSLKGRTTAEVRTSNAQFNEIIKRSVSDINMMVTATAYGSYPYGGIPWFCTPFGRDGIITALECLWIKPDLAKGVLKYLASRQARELDRGKAAEPGKIMHETRGGELAALNEIPFGLYYGSIDSTPLFIALAGAYWRRTGDLAFIKRLWPNIEAALKWIDEYGDPDNDGFLEYSPHEAGLRNQGWKDSQDSVFHEDGSLAKGAIALCEVQGYLYAALKEAASLARLLGKDAMSEKLIKRSDELKERFDRSFWDSGLNSYVLALDGDKEPCRVMASNAGHALFSGIASPERALRAARTLTSEPLFSGWGIRTVGANEVRYNPMSYHNGSVWPHDNAMTGYGLASYGLTGHFNRVFSAIFDAAASMEFQRLPELFCGFHRRRGVPPTLYPVACSPQTWAAGSLLYMLQASLGLHFEVEKKMIIFKRPVLPEFLGYVYLNRLPVDGRGSVDLLISRYGEEITVEALRKPEDVSILIIK